MKLSLIRTEPIGEEEQLFHKRFLDLLSQPSCRDSLDVTFKSTPFEKFLIHYDLCCPAMKKKNFPSRRMR